MAEKQVDVRKKDYIAISSVPTGVFDTLSATLTLDPGETGTILIFVVPDDIRLSLWNGFMSIFVDTNAPGNIFPEGADLNVDQKGLNVSMWPDWGASSDVNNVRAYKVRLWNQNYLTHTYYMRFKAYTFATVPGSG